MQIDENLVVEMDVKDGHVATGMDNAELQEFMDFVLGNSTEPPAVMDKIMVNLITKLSMGLGYNVVSNITRQASLTKFLTEAEERLFDPKEVADMDRGELEASYKVASKTLDTLFETQRKFIVQNKDLLQTDNSPQEKIVAKLMTLPPDKMESVMRIIEGLDEETAEDVDLDLED